MDLSSIANPSVLTAAGPQVTLGYRYCPGAATSCSSNNGNLQSASIVSAEGLNVSQNYGYDQLNRLTGLTESASSVVKWNQAYTYDQWGNRAVAGNYIPNPYATPSALAQYSNNQRGGPGVSYDQAGNQLSLPARTFTYDAENRLNASTQLSAGTIQYLYDGTGKRVQRILGTTATVFVYDAKGDLAAEYSNAGATNGGVQYLIGDPLGSTRAIINGSSGQVMQRLDYLPFGEEINTGTSGRSSIYPSGIYPSAPDISSMKFTSKERDAETGLDYFGARYFSGGQGRFTSPDRVFFQADMLTDPQRFNLYAYVRNNPLRFVDPNGEAIELLGDDDQRRKALEALQAAVGSKAGQYLYQNKVESVDANGNKQASYYVGVLDGGPSGKGPAFSSLNSAAKSLSGIINDEQVVSVKVVSSVDQAPVPGGSLFAYGAVGATTGTIRSQPISVYVQDPKEGYPQIPGRAMSNGLPGAITPANNLFHELGHADAFMGDREGRNVGSSYQHALDFENQVRRLRDPNAPIRIQH